MNSTNVCLIENSDTEINNLAQSIFIVLSFCSVISNFVIYSDKLLENNKNFKKINSTYNVLKEYFFNNYKEDKDGNIIIENDLMHNKPIIPNSVEVEKEIKEMLNYKSPPVSIKSNKNKIKKEINDFLNDSDTEDTNKKVEISNDEYKFKNKNIFKDDNLNDKLNYKLNDKLNNELNNKLNDKLNDKSNNDKLNDKLNNDKLNDNNLNDDNLNDDNLNDYNLNDNFIKDRNNIKIKHKKKESSSNKNIDKHEKRRSKNKL